MPITDLPILERIAVELFNRLERVAEGNRLPDANLVEVLRSKRLGDWTPQHLQIVLTQDNPVFNDGASHPGNPPAIAYDVTFNVRVHLMPSEKDPTPIDTYINILAADITMALTTDVGSHWYDFNDLAVDAHIGGVEQIDSEGGVDGFNLPIVVTYRHSEDNPYEVRL